MKTILKKAAASIVVLALVFTAVAPWPVYAQTDKNIMGGRSIINPEPVELTGFEYTLNEATRTVTLEKYKGTNKTIVVYDEYIVEGKEYKTVLNTNTVFLNNTSITSVKICNGVTFKDNSMSHLFAGCKNLTSVDLTEVNTTGVTDMSFMFYYCLKLASIDVSAFDTSAVTTFESLFDRCQKVTSLTGYEDWNTSNVVKIYKAFNRVSFDYLADEYKNVRLQCIDISNWDLDQINNSGWCFQQCRVNSILLPDNLSTMSAGFMNHAAQFEGTSLTIPKGVKKIGYAHTFYDMGTNDFVEIKVADGNKYYKSVDGVLYSADGKELLGVPRNKPFENNVFEIPEGVTFLAELCFSRNQNFHTIVLPDTYVMRQFVQDNDPRYQVFEDNGNINWGNSLSIATYLYTSVANYEVKDTNPNYASHEGILYTKDMKTLLAVPILYDKVLRVPEGVERWESYAIWDDISHTYYKNFKGVSIPASMTYIGRDQLKRINLLKEKFSTFTIEVDEDNPVYRINEKGYLEAYAISPQAIILDADEFEYDGTAKEPSVKVSFDDQEFIDERIASHLGDNLSIDGLIEYLEEGVDYTVAYSNNTEAGTATVTVTGIGKYSGTATKNFIIKSFNDGKESDKTESNGKTDGVSTTPNRPNDGGNVAQTGDSANVMIYIVFAGVTALAMMAFAIFRKKVN